MNWETGTENSLDIQARLRLPTLPAPFKWGVETMGHVNQAALRVFIRGIGKVEMVSPANNCFLAVLNGLRSQVPGKGIGRFLLSTIEQAAWDLNYTMLQGSNSTPMVNGLLRHRGWTVHDTPWFTSRRTLSQIWVYTKILRERLTVVQPDWPAVQAALKVQNTVDDPVTFTTAALDIQPFPEGDTR